MLKGIPAILSPEMLKILMGMGHGDEIILVYGNFPAASNAQRLLRCDGHGVTELLDAFLKFFPLDTFVQNPVSLMAVVLGDNYKPEIWKEFKKVMKKYEERDIDYEYVERFQFYERTRKAFAVIATSESARYVNIILKKGIVGD